MPNFGDLLHGFQSHEGLQDYAGLELVIMSFMRDSPIKKKTQEHRMRERIEVRTL